MTDLRFYNTASRQKEKFKPIDKDNIRIYVCGPTVYDFAHIGNARPVIVFDILFRLLSAVYGREHVRYVRNITDVDDKINARAARDYPDKSLNDAIRLVTNATLIQFHDDVSALNCLPPTKEPRATENIEKMKMMIDRLVENGHAYVKDDHVLFSVPAMNNSASANKYANPAYGLLSRRPSQDMQAGARVDVADYKQDDQDFVLWKPSKEGEPGWPSPAGISVLGRPGWHIECSAMSMGELLEPFGGGLQCNDPVKNSFDIHGGGLDLIFPHHENEIAQSCCTLNNQQMANLWMHNGFILVDGHKMSKSTGNFITIRDILETKLAQAKHLSTSSDDKILSEQWAGMAARFAILQTHYRQPLDWTEQRFEAAAEEFSKLASAVINANLTRQSSKGEENIPHEILDALADDLNTPRAIAALHQYYNQGDIKKLSAGLALLGLDNFALLEHLAKTTEKEENALEPMVLPLITKRAAFIAERNWDEADKIRDLLADKGIKLQDTVDKTTGKRTTTWSLM